MVLEVGDEPLRSPKELRVRDAKVGDRDASNALLYLGH
jgi:hypothetical protein